MRRRLRAAVMALACASSGAAYASEGGTITVVFSGLKSEKGTVLVQLANSKADYDDDTGAFRIGDTRAHVGRITVVFERVPAGEYAVKVFQDENDNRKIDVGLTGPKEPYGFSNNVMGTFGPPGWDAAKFVFDGGSKTVEIDAR